MARSTPALARWTVFVLLMAGCEARHGAASDRGGDVGSPLNAPQPGASAVDQPHVVFTERSIVLDQVGVATSPPVTVPSRPSPATMASDDSTIVRVDPSGRLVGLRPGTTTVRAAAGSSSLDVEVRILGGLAIVPARVELRPGRSTLLTLVDPTTGAEVPASAAAWTSSSPRHVVIRDGVAHASAELGISTVTARFGGHEASGEIAVAVEAGGRLRVEPARLTLHVGEARQLQVLAGGTPLSASWSTGDRKVVASGPQGLVLALAIGRASVCASSGVQKACTSVEVQR